jgi:hypothetical protein
MEKKFEVKLIKKKEDLDSFLENQCGIEQFKKDREERINDMICDFEFYLINEAIRLKSRVLFVVNYTKYKDMENGTRGDVVFKSFVDKDKAYEFLSQAKKEDFFASVCDYHFDRLLKMSDIEFEGMPDLGSKDLARKYREVMREQG